MNCPHCGQVIKKPVTVQRLERRKHARKYRKTEKWKAYHREYMRKRREAFRIANNIT